MDQLKDSTTVARLFREVMHLFRQSMSKIFEDSGITVPQSLVIGILSKEKTLKITDLSAKLSLCNSTVSGIVDRLEKQGVVERKRSEQDKRVVYVSLTPEFQDMNHNFHRQIEETIAGIMKRGTPEELDKIFEGLGTLKKLLTGSEE